MPTEFPSLDAALGTIMFRIMSETLTADIPKDRLGTLDKVRAALIEAWPSELETSRRRTVWRSTDSGGSQALYDETK